MTPEYPPIRGNFIAQIGGRFRRLTPLIRYPVVGVSVFLGLLPAVAFLYGLLVGVEFAVRYSLHQAYCAACDEGSLISSRVAPPATCHDSDSQLAYHTIRDVFAPPSAPPKTTAE